MRATGLLVVGVSVAAAEASVVRQAPLNQWTFSSRNGSITIANATTPGTSHMHLLEAGVLLEDPYRRFNELAFQWVAQTTWMYETELPAGIVGSDKARVVFETLDGVAHVALNGESLGPPAVNAFYPHAFDLPRTLLRADGGNLLRVTFTPPLAYMEKEARSYPYYVPATRNFNVWAEPTHRPFLRKAGSDFGWDWGPAYATTGIAGPAFIEWLDTDGGAEGRAVALHELNVAYELLGIGYTTATGNVSVVVNRTRSVGTLLLQLFIDGDKHGDTVKWHVPRSVDPSWMWNSHEVTLPFTVKNPTLWWPAGYGSPHLYDIRVEAVDLDHAHTTASISHGVGFRMVELIQAPSDAGGISGATFYFRINGVAVFAKGANWIPNDSFPTRVTRAKLDLLLQSALAANMNMLRVWGGGRYESDAFYATCDRLGLLVWHEFMFACAMYPRHAPFLQDVQREVTYQTRRLRKHTSVAIWGGNNENENMMASFTNGDFMPPGERFNRDVFVVDVTVLFVDLVRPLVLALDVSRPFVDTSPSNGLLSTEPYVKRWGANTNDVAFGDVHFYDYTHDCQDPTMYPHARFVSEFGFQSMPSVHSLETVSDAALDWGSFQAFWKMLKFRERHENGTAQMATQISRRFHVPFPFLSEAWLGTPLAGGGFALDVKRRVAAYVYLTQVQQALCYETAIHTWRRGRHASRGGTMGVLYWQLNDVWQGTSWSSLEFSGQWKSLQYAIKRAYAPLILTVHSDDAELVVFAVSDVPDSIVEVKIAVELVDTRDGRVVDESSLPPHRVQPLGSQPLARLSVATLLASGRCDAVSCFLRLRCEVASDSKQQCDDAVHFFAPYKELRLRHGNVTIVSVKKKRGHAYEVTLQGDGFVALFVELYASTLLGFWDRNVFHLVGSEPQTLRFTAAANEDGGDLTAEEFARGLELRWLQQTYESEAVAVIE